MNKPERLPHTLPMPTFFADLGMDADSGEKTPGELLHRMIALGLDQLCLPGQGLTLSRWQALAAVAAQDLSLVKLYEAHTDALAILAEAAQFSGDAASSNDTGAYRAPPHAAWAVWCAEPPDARVLMVPEQTGGAVRLSGTKAWCSGAAAVTHALVSCRDAADRPCLAAVALKQPGVTVTDQGWQAVGMAATGSVDVHFDHALAHQIGAPGFYTERAGFWHGGAGIAACWYGAAARLAGHLRDKLAQRSVAGRDPHALAHLGQADVALSMAAAQLRQTARWIDTYPQQDAQQSAMRARLAAEQAADAVIKAAGRSLGAALYCRDRVYGRLLADLPVFLRQSHAERDLAALGGLAITRGDEGESPWAL